VNFKQLKLDQYSWRNSSSKILSLSLVLFLSLTRTSGMLVSRESPRASAPLLPGSKLMSLLWQASLPGRRWTRSTRVRSDIMSTALKYPMSRGLPIRSLVLDRHNCYDSTCQDSSRISSRSNRGSMRLTNFFLEPQIVPRDTPKEISRIGHSQRVGLQTCVRVHNRLT